MTALKMLVGCLAVVAMASWAQKDKAPSPPLKKSAIPNLVVTATLAQYKCKGQKTLCVIPVYVRARAVSDPALDSNGKPIYCVATIDFDRIRTAKALSLYFVVINVDSTPDKAYRFSDTGLWFSSAPPDADNSSYVRKTNGDTAAEWLGGAKSTTHGGGDGWAFLPWIYYDDGGTSRTCHAADPLIANDG